MRHSMLKTEYGDVHYWFYQHENINTKCLVFCHGVTGDHTMFQRQVEYFKSEYSILIWDIPMHGDSRPYKVYSFEHNAQVLQQILEDLNVEESILIGMSNGGYTCQTYIDMYPNKVNAFVAIDTTPLANDYYTFFDKLTYSLFAKSIILFPEKTLRKQMASSSARSEEGQAYMKAVQSKMTKAEIAYLTDKAFKNLMIKRSNIVINCPTLILLGEHDHALKVDVYSKKWSQDTGFPLVLIKDAGHLSNIDNHKQVNVTIKDFLDNIKSGA